ncbi:monofunctional biosynthetic peptidoglycan transglycosylase [Desulfococcus sp.]|uniref:monofunctional biosynthetic peptidoglycan transglycosylase n=1 Tax=Desulfococcus sp. TaxID=2025834 RepID=UPI0035948B50
MSRGKPKGRGLWRWLFYLPVLWVISTSLAVLAFRGIDPPLWAWRIHRALAPPLAEMPRTRHQWVPLEKIATAMQLSAIAAEDQLFPRHRGFDWRAIAAAMEDNEERDRVRGASTITQQTAKNLFLWPSRTWLRKGVEAYFTVLLETFWPKQRILEVYLNIVEFGPNLYGVEAAGRHFYGRSAARLNADQAARLAAVLPNPYRYRADRPSDYVIRRGRWIRQQMRQLGEGVLAFRE